jgi:hypothetical protein
MGPASHFLFGALCGAALGALGGALAPPGRRAWVALWLPPFVLACGFWGELPWLLGIPETAHPLANLCFGYAWLHPWFQGHETLAFAAALAVANLLVLAYVIFLTRCFSTAALIRWEREGPASRRRGDGRPSASRRASGYRWGR